MFSLRFVFSAFFVVTFILCVGASPVHADGIFNFLKKKPEQQGQVTGTITMKEAIRGGKQSNNSSSSPIFLKKRYNNNQHIARSYRGPSYVGREASNASSDFRQREIERKDRMSVIRQASDMRIQAIMPRVERNRAKRERAHQEQLNKLRVAEKKRNVREEEKRVKMQYKKEEMYNRKQKPLRLFEELR